MFILLQFLINARSGKQENIWKINHKVVGHWIKLRKSFRQIFLQKRDNLSENYPGGSQIINIKCFTCQYKDICPKFVLLVPTENSKVDRGTCRKPAKIFQDRSHWIKADWSMIISRGESPSEILRIMLSGLQNKEIQKQKSNYSPISDIDLKQWIYPFISRV